MLFERKQLRRLLLGRQQQRQKNICERRRQRALGRRARH
ncbi:hypothetical protein Ahy_B03g065152 isoform B [Arachis hypogaea]|uniref:Uncharacterized protein n=1 Tax=Arachis hypogaea TaxID=3818 RepID=A0A445A0W2_ARAHY|nr:hypothetical protein Ahy_B03g065152 isoform B [Arachis hypogaea]